MYDPLQMFSKIIIYDLEHSQPRCMFKGSVLWELLHVGSGSSHPLGIGMNETTGEKNNGLRRLFLWNIHRPAGKYGGGGGGGTFSTAGFWTDTVFKDKVNGFSSTFW